MPYRRLPQTDQARLRALKTVIQKCDAQSFGNIVVEFQTILDAKNFLKVFEGNFNQYKETFENQVAANKKYQQLVANARMYISHFIQVFNMAVMRGEIKKERKLLYGLDPELHTLPDLSSEDALMHWGEAVVKGENERIMAGGVPIYNPTISKVKVHYEIFKERYNIQKTHKSTTNRNRNGMIDLREKCDELILKIWDQVEENLKDESPQNRIKKAREYGLIYYLRKGEKEGLAE